jgi:hypothetical protein
VISFHSFAPNQSHCGAFDAQPCAVLVFQLIGSIDKHVFRIVVEGTSETTESPFVSVSGKQKGKRINAITD